MSLRAYVFLMLGGTLISWAAWIFVLLNVDATFANWFEFIFFYLSFFLSIVGTMSLIGLGVRKVMFKGEFEVVNVKISFRQSIWFGLLIIIAMMMAANKLLTTANTIFLICLLAVLEFFFAFKND